MKYLLLALQLLEQLYLPKWGYCSVAKTCTTLGNLVDWACQASLSFTIPENSCQLVW